MLRLRDDAWGPARASTAQRAGRRHRGADHRPAKSPECEPSQRFGFLDDSAIAPSRAVRSCAKALPDEFTAVICRKHCSRRAESTRRCHKQAHRTDEAHVCRVSSTPSRDRREVACRSNLPRHVARSNRRDLDAAPCATVESGAREVPLLSPACPYRVASGSASVSGTIGAPSPRGASSRVHQPTSRHAPSFQPIFS